MVELASAEQSNFEKQNPRNHEFIRERETSTEEQEELDLVNKIQDYLSDGQDITELEEQLKTTITKYGLDSEKVIKSWKTQVHWGLYADLEGNIYFMQTVEREQPGITKFLYEKFGICNFIRYEPWVLLDQYKNNEDDKLPYGIVVTPYNDSNGAFASYNQKEIWAKFVSEIYGKYRVRFFEGQTYGDIVKGLKHCGNTYTNNKISFLFLGGHGTPDTIDLGGENITGGVLKTADVEKIQIERLQKFFIDNPRVVLIACSTGVDNGIAQALSKLNTEVVAPDKNAQLLGITPHFNQNGIDFDITFRGIKETPRFVAGQLAKK